MIIKTLYSMQPIDPQESIEGRAFPVFEYSVDTQDYEQAFREAEFAVNNAHPGCFIIMSVPADAAKL